MSAKEFIDRVPEGIEIDETILHAGKVSNAYGHTATMLVYYSREGNAYTAERCAGRKYRDMHDELYSATYSRNSKYDLT